MITHINAGNSVCAFVHGFEPYFYIESPLDFSADDCDSLRSLLDVCPVLLNSMHQSRASDTVSGSPSQPLPLPVSSHGDGS